MIKDAIKYTIIILIVIGIVLVMRGLIKDDGSNNKLNNNNSDETKFYNANVGLYEDGTDKLLSGANLIVKDSSGNEIANFTSGEDLYVVNNLKVGTYTLEEVSAPDYYKKAEEKVTFVIKNKDVDVKMYNVLMSDEELKEAGIVTTSSSDVGVENTMSSSSKLLSILSILVFMSGIYIVSYVIVKNKYFS